jgi:hypothetical protein
VSPEVKHGRRSWGLQNPDTWINLAFPVRLADRNIEQAEAKTTKDQTILKRRPSARLARGDFLSMESWSPSFRKKPSFQLLQVKISQSLPIYFYAFDLLNRNGGLLVNLPLSRRRELLESLLTAQGSAAPVSIVAGANERSS